jgi:hypothetical protein
MKQLGATSLPRSVALAAYPPPTKVKCSVHD